MQVTRERAREYIRQTAKDYDMPYDKVEAFYKKATDIRIFGQLLEAEVRKDAVHESGMVSMASYCHH